MAMNIQTELHARGRCHSGGASESALLPPLWLETDSTSPPLESVGPGSPWEERLHGIKGPGMVYRHLLQLGAPAQRRVKEDIAIKGVWTYAIGRGTIIVQ